MVNIAILKESADKTIRTEKCFLSALDSCLDIIEIPVKRGAIGWKSKQFLRELCLDAGHVLTESVFLKKYQKGLSDKTILQMFPTECVFALLESVNSDNFAIYTDFKTVYLMNLICLFGKKFSYLTIYTSKTEMLKNVSDYIFETLGLPIKSKQYHPEQGIRERYLMIVKKQEVSVIDFMFDREFADVQLSFCHPLNMYSDTLLTEILKITAEKGMCQNVFTTNKVKIVGEISK